VTDYCEKYVALDRQGTPRAFVVVSPASHPRSVLDAANTTRTVRQALGSELGDSVLAPYCVGDIDGCSYSITAYCRPMSSGRWLSRWQQLRMTPAILSWLARATRHTARLVEDIDTQVRTPLHALAEHGAVDPRTRQAASNALKALDGGDWRPRNVVAHNDLWWGNFVHREPVAGAQPPFYVIDWAGGTTTGVPFYDLIRICRSLRLGSARTRRAIRTHREILACAPADVLHYLATSFGTLSRHLGEWPERQFARAADECIRYATRSLEGA
jgi:hypothetical protein